MNDREPLCSHLAVLPESVAVRTLSLPLFRLAGDGVAAAADAPEAAWADPDGGLCCPFCGCAVSASSHGHR